MPLRLYLLYALRPLHAYYAVEVASTGVVELLHLKSKQRQEPKFRELCSRAYWACYILQHELRPHVGRSTQVIGGIHEVVDLPGRTGEDTDSPPHVMLWFLSEIGLRKVFTDVMGDIHLPGAEESHTEYKLPVTDALVEGLTTWYRTLPPQLRFRGGPNPWDEGLEILQDPRKAFLRTQYYAAHAVELWSSIVRLLTASAGPLPEHEHVQAMRNAEASIQWMVKYLLCSEHLLEDRHQLLFANLLG